MKIEQISIFIENKTGRLAEVSGVLGDAGVNIRAFSLADTSDFGILRLIVDQTDRAREVLKAKGFTVNQTEVIAVEVPDQPNGLHGILSILDVGGINIEYMYTFIEHSAGKAAIIFRFDDIDQAIEVLRKGGVNVLKGHRIFGS